MKVYEATYCMGGIVDGGFFKSLVAAHSSEDVKRVLNETHMDDVFDLNVTEASSTNHYSFEEVLTTEYR